MTVTVMNRNGSLAARANNLARFQKQQLTEKENRLLVRFENSRNFLLNRISGPPPASSTSTGSQSSSLSSSSSSWSQKSRKGHDKGNLLDPIENQIEKKHNGLRGRFSKSSEPKLKTSHKNENRRNMSHSPFKLPSKSKSETKRVEDSERTRFLPSEYKSVSPSSEEIKKKRRVPVGQGSSKVRETKRSNQMKLLQTKGTNNISKAGHKTRQKFAPKPGLVQCKNCSRNFAEERINVHSAICNKTAKKKRRPFDASQARVGGTEAAQYQMKPNTKTRSLPKSDWRKKREEFIRNLRAAKEAQKFLAKGGNVRDLPPPPPSDTSDYIQCQYCQRKFAQNVAERHIPKCKNIESNKSNKKKTKR